MDSSLKHFNTLSRGRRFNKEKKLQSFINVLKLDFPDMPMAGNMQNVHTFLFLMPSRYNTVLEIRYSTISDVVYGGLFLSCVWVYVQLFCDCFIVRLVV